MSDATYSRISNGCFLVAVASALVFEKLGSYGWVAGLVGILSLVLAAVTYLLNLQHRDSPTDSTEQESRPAVVEPTEEYESQSLSFAPLIRTSLKHSGYVVLSGDITDLPHTFVSHSVALRHLWSSSAGPTFWDRVEGIIARLSSEGRQLPYEIELHREGRCIIRPVGYKSDLSDSRVLADVILQEAEQSQPKPN